MASRGHKVNLQDALLDTPKLRGHLSQLESTLAPFRDYVTLLRDTFQACHLHQEKVGEGARALANLLSSIDSEVGEKTATASSSAFAQLARYQNELHSCQEMLTSQLQNSVVNRVSALLDEDMDNLQSLKEVYDSSRLEHEHAMAKFSRTSKRRDSEKSCFEANAELYVARKKFYQCCLDYCSQLNEFQMKKKITLLEPVLTFMHAQMSYFKACHEIMSTGFQQLLTNLHSDIQSYTRDYENEARELGQQKVELELQFPSLCLPDPDLSDPFTEFPTANTELTSKYGYLYLRVQKGGLAAKWERTFFFTKNGYLYTQSLNKGAEVLLRLKDSEAFSCDCDDRRYVVQVSHSTLKKPLFLQAENDTQRTEWIAVINNNSVRKTQHGASVGGQSADADRLRTRLYDSLERERIRSWATKELQQESATPTSSSSTAEKSSSGLKISTSSGRSRSPLRGFLKSQTGRASGDSKSSQKGLLGRNGKRSTSASVLPATSSGSKLADVENWVNSITTTTAVATSVSCPPPRPPYPPSSTSSGGLTKPTPPHSQNGGPAGSPALPVKFPVKYLGQTEVQDAKNPSTISATIRGVMTARSVKRVKPAHSIELVISLKKITLTEVLSNKAVGGFLLKDILNCAPHPENQELFGVICRTTSPAGPDKVKYICHVMQAEHSGAQVCVTISSAIQTVWKMMQSKGGDQKSSDMTTPPPIPAKGPPTRPPPPVAPYSGTLSSLHSYSPVPAGLATRQRTHTSPATLQSSTSLAPDSREEVGVAGSGAMLSILTLPPNLPDTCGNSTSAESLSLGRLDEEDRLQKYTNTAADSPLISMFVDEEIEELPLISFDQGDLRDPSLGALALADGYVNSNMGSGGDRDFSSPTPPGASSSSTVLAAGFSSSGYMSVPRPSSTSPSPSPTPPIITSSTQLPLPPRTVTKFSPSPPPQVSPTQTPTPSQLPPAPSTKSHPLKPTPSPPHPTSNPASQTTKSGKENNTTPAKQRASSEHSSRSAADSLAQALGFETIPTTSFETVPATTSNTKSSEKDKAATTVTPAVTSSSTTDSLAEAFGFNTTPEDIDNIIEMMGPDMDMYPHTSTGAGGGISDSGYMTSNPMQAESSNYTYWANFEDSN